jgi:RHS repeat-associated protein
VGTLHEEAGGITSNYIFAGSSRVAMRRSDGTLLYYHANHLGSTHIVTNSSGAQVEEIQYEPFGKTFTDTGTFDVNHKYTSQEFDSETDLYYYRARYDDPSLGRFISPDRIGIKMRSPQTLNRYSYVLNNPIRYTDPTGRHVDAAGTVVQVIPDEFGTNQVVVIAGSEPPLLGKHILLKGQMEGGMIIAT